MQSSERRRQLKILAFRKISIKITGRSTKFVLENRRNYFTRKICQLCPPRSEIEARQRTGSNGWQLFALKWNLQSEFVGWPHWWGECQMALGKEVKDEGLIGLIRGFIYADSLRVVASLWKVTWQLLNWWSDFTAQSSVRVCGHRRRCAKLKSKSDNRRDGRHRFIGRRLRYRANGVR